MADSPCGGEADWARIQGAGRIDTLRACFDEIDALLVAARGEQRNVMGAVSAHTRLRLEQEEFARAAAEEAAAAQALEGPKAAPETTRATAQAAADNAYAAARGLQRGPFEDAGDAWFAGADRDLLGDLIS